MRNSILVILSVLLVLTSANISFAACTNQVIDKEAVINLSDEVNTTKIDAKTRRQQRKEFVQGVREQLRAYRKTAGVAKASQGICVLIAIFLPFIGVLLYEGSLTVNFWISLILSFLFLLPGLIFALLVIFDVV